MYPQQKMKIQNQAVVASTSASSGSYPMRAYSMTKNGPNQRQLSVNVVGSAGDSNQVTVDKQHPREQLLFFDDRSYTAAKRLEVVSAAYTNTSLPEKARSLNRTHLASNANSPLKNRAPVSVGRKKIINTIPVSTPKQVVSKLFKSESLTPTLPEISPIIS